jgi:hypothetical protein
LRRRQQEIADISSPIQSIEKDIEVLKIELEKMWN